MRVLTLIILGKELGKISRPLLLFLFSRFSLGLFQASDFFLLMNPLDIW
jgi:hypothetical protein